MEWCPSCGEYVSEYGGVCSSCGGLISYSYDEDDSWWNDDDEDEE